MHTTTFSSISPVLNSSDEFWSTCMFWHDWMSLVAYIYKYNGAVPHFVVLCHVMLLQYFKTMIYVPCELNFAQVNIQIQLFYFLVSEEMRAILKNIFQWHRFWRLACFSQAVSEVIKIINNPKTAGDLSTCYVVYKLTVGHSWPCFLLIISWEMTIGHQPEHENLHAQLDRLLLGQCFFIYWITGNFLPE